jgi:hypothetical protein
MKPFHIARRWAIRVTDEFFLQVAREREILIDKLLVRVHIIIEMLLVDRAKGVSIPFPR